jgi:hypothetical protein
VITEADLDLVTKLMTAMLANKVFHVEMGSIKLEMSQYAFAPSPPAMPAAPPMPMQPEAFSSIGSPFEAFRKPPEIQPWNEAAPDPIDPNALVDDRALFAADLPLEP